MMNNITIKRAQGGDIPAIEGIYRDTVAWLCEMGQSLWAASDLTWDALSKLYRLDDFYIAYLNGAPAGSMVLVDFDPFFWPEAAKGQSLFLHKLAIKKSARKTGVADAMMDFFKQEALSRGIKTVELETHAARPRLRAFYERHGFGFVKTVDYGPDRPTAFYAFILD